MFFGVIIISPYLKLLMSQCVIFMNCHCPSRRRGILRAKRYWRCRSFSYQMEIQVQVEGKGREARGRLLNNSYVRGKKN
jgi:hypothetical protein